MSAARRRGGLAWGIGLALATAGCPPDPDPGAKHRLFVPAVVESKLSGRAPWFTDVVLTSSTEQDVLLRRWPPAKPGEESEVLRTEAGKALSVRAGGSWLPGVSSLLFTAASPFQVAARVGRRDRPEAPGIDVPVLAASELAMPGDVLRLGTFRNDEQVRSHFCVTVPATEAEAVPFLLEMTFRQPGGAVLATAREVAPGVPLPVEEPWARYGVAAGTPFDLEARFLGSVRARAPVLGLWIYGIEQEKATARSRFLTTTVVRRRA